ncbi:electron transfer flavoprotein beta subunit [Faunimonas pinastri]|uniref:Electron transfer flavoprotein beta subunit n=1 Tax=Faunimonas pinastri TaxID=1855383 RepID=A0A1H9HWI6_9HYPH|nr:electron transfer flavoprotein subunit beta [Faunimonas pinastri]SEQ66699.1 electron transfer flavoprotein beta subunit [Faunimonas pinastri]
MRIVVLLSAGLHPVSGRTVLQRLEAQAIRLGRSLMDDAGDEILGLHAGPDPSRVADAFGYGLDRMICCRIADGDDPVPSLSAALADLAPDLVLAGRRSQGADETGLVPYQVARDLGLPLAADAAGLMRQGFRIVVDQALPKGVRRRSAIGLPALVSVHSAAPPPLPFVFAAMRRGRADERPGIAAPVAPRDLEERPHRPRARIIGQGGGSAAERLKAATETAKAGGDVLVDPSPDEAARAVVDYLRRIGALGPAPR